MAVPTGSGTETIHAHSFDNVDLDQTLIFGLQHHVYTVISIIVYCNVLDDPMDFGFLKFIGHDGHAGAAGVTMYMAKFNIQVGETYVWNDKFSFNGVEPTGTNVMSASEQIAIAAQSGSNVQKINFDMTDAADDFDIHVSYLDQDWT